MDVDEPEVAVIELIVNRGTAAVQDRAVHEEPKLEAEVLGVAALRRELEGLRMMALHSRATSEGIDDARIDAAMESAHPKAAMIQLLLQGSSAALRRELEGLRVMQLHRRAVSEGCPADAVEEAMDGSAPKQQLIDLILSV